MVMRGRPDSGSMMRINCGGRNIRPNRGNRGAKSVIRTAPPRASVNTVDTTAVLRRYSDCWSTIWSSTTSENPFSSSPAIKRQKIGSLSKRG